MSEPAPIDIELCAYCGVNPSEEPDHVIPQCLFSGPVTPGYIKVPVCRDCNVEKSKYDTDLRDLLIADINTVDHPIVKTLIPKLVRGIEHANKRGSHTILSRNGFEEVSKIGVHNLYLGKDIAARINNEDLVRIFTMTIQGLYFDLRQERLPKDIKVSAKKIENPSDIELLFNIFMQAPNRHGPRFIGENVFFYLGFIPDDNPVITRWFLCFYNTVCFVISTNPISKTEPNRIYKRKPKKGYTQV